MNDNTRKTQCETLFRWLWQFGSKKLATTKECPTRRFSTLVLFSFARDSGWMCVQINIDTAWDPGRPTHHHRHHHVQIGNFFFPPSMNAYYKIFESSTYLLLSLISFCANICLFTILHPFSQFYLSFVRTHLPISRLRRPHQFQLFLSLSLSSSSSSSHSFSIRVSRWLTATVLLCLIDLLLYPFLVLRSPN